jgi:hypothetical protein
MIHIIVLLSILLISLFIGSLRGGNVETLESIQLVDYSPNIASNTRVTSANIASNTRVTSANISSNTRVTSANIASNTRVTSANTRVTSASISGTIRP